MTTSDIAPKRVYVWVWLPGSTEPVPAGVIEQSGEVAYFNYGRSYLERENTMAIYLPELPLRRGRIRPPQGLTIAGCLSDAGPDAWGRRVIRYRMLGTTDLNSDDDDLTELTYLLESGSDRIGPSIFNPALRSTFLGLARQLSLKCKTPLSDSKRAFHSPLNSKWRSFTVPRWAVPDQRRYSRTARGHSSRNFLRPRTVIQLSKLRVLRWSLPDELD